MKGLRILVVDDEKSVLRALRVLIERAGHECETISSSIEAINRLKEKDFDVLVADLHLPELNGLQIIHLIKPLRPYLVPLILTGFGTREETLSALKEGVFDLVEKPISNPEVFSMVLERAGYRSRLMRERDQLTDSLKRKNRVLETNIKHLRRAYARLQEHERQRDHDLRRAQMIQQSLLPRGFPSGHGFDCFGFYRPCQLLGGDYFDAIPLGDGRLAIYLADGVGHGVGAAMLTVIIRELIHSQLMSRHQRGIFAHPIAMLEFLNQGLLDQAIDVPHHVTMGCLVLDARGHRLSYANAGHTEPLLISADGTDHAIKIHGPALGLESHPHFELHERQFFPGDRLVLYSDGLLSTTPRDSAQANRSDLIHLVKECSGNHVTSRHIGRAIENHLKRRLHGRPPEDDVSFLVVKPSQREPESENGLIPNSVRIVTGAEPATTSEPDSAGIAVGESGDCLVIHLRGMATWKLGQTLQARLDQAKKNVFIDLAACESLDSTLLGILVQHADSITLCATPPRIHQQLQELGVHSHFRLDPNPPPQVPCNLARPVQRNFQTDTDLVYSAHQSLIQANPENRERFGDLLQALGRHRNSDSDSASDSEQKH